MVSAMRLRLSRLTVDDLLSNLLLYLVLAGYILLVYGMVIVVLLLLNFELAVEQEPLFNTPWWVNTIVIILVALTLVPVRRWLQIQINAMIYGQYDDPYTLVSTINSQLQAMNSPQMTLPIVAETIARTLKLPYIAIRVSSTSTSFHYEFGSKPVQSEVTTLPLFYLEKSMGELTVSS
jgi:hypothetical protein